MKVAAKFSLIFASLLFFVVSLQIPLFAENRCSSNKTAKIGVVLGLTGAASAHARAIRLGLMLAADELREKGYCPDLHFEDDQTNPAKTVTAFRYLIARGYRLFIGPTWSFQARAVMPIVERAGAVAVLPVSSSLINGGASKSLFNLCARRDRQKEPIVKWLKAYGHVRAAVLTPQGDWGEVHRKVFESALKDTGNTVVLSELYNYGTNAIEFKALLLKAKAKGGNLIMTTGDGGDLASLVRARNELKLKLPILSTYDIMDAVNQKLISLEALNPKSVYILGVGPIDRDFKRRFMEKYKEAPPRYADYGYDSLYVLMRSVEAVGGEDPAKVRRYLGNDFKWVGVTGEIQFDQNGDIKRNIYRVDPLPALLGRS